MKYIHVVIYRYKNDISLTAQEGAIKYADVRIVSYAGPKSPYHSFLPYITTSFKVVIRFNLKDEEKKIVLLDCSQLPVFTNPKDFHKMGVIIKESSNEGVFTRIEIHSIGEEGQTPLQKSSKSTKQTPKLTPPLALKLVDVEASELGAKLDNVVSP